MSAPALPPPRSPRAAEAPYRIAFGCLGNICRSPTAEVVLTEKVQRAGLSSRVAVESFGTGDWHVGERMDPRAAAALRAAGYEPDRHRARQVEPSMLEAADVILVMDRSNLRDVRRSATRDEDRERIRLFRTYDGQAGGADEVPDPWYGGANGFDEVLAIVERATDRIVDALCASLDAAPSDGIG